MKYLVKVTKTIYLPGNDEFDYEIEVTAEADVYTGYFKSPWDNECYEIQIESICLGENFIFGEEFEKIKKILLEDDLFIEKCLEEAFSIQAYEFRWGTYDENY